MATPEGPKSRLFQIERHFNFNYHRNANFEYRKSEKGCPANRLLLKPFLAGY